MRARNIKPGFYKNEKLAECSAWARLLAPGLWMIADRDGRLEDRPKRIKGEIFPYDDIDADSLLGELEACGHIKRYVVAGERYIQILTFAEHQQPHVREKASVYPGVECADNETSTNLGSAQHQPRQCPAPPDSLNPDSLNPESSSLANANSPRARAPDPPDGEISKKPAKQKITLDELTVDHIAAWLAQKRSEGRYLRHDEHFILEYFRNYCISKGKRYADYTAAYRNAFEWSACQPGAGRSPSGGAIDARDPASRAKDIGEQIIARRNAEAARAAGLPVMGAGGDSLEHGGKKSVEPPALPDIRGPTILRGQGHGARGP